MPSVPPAMPVMPRKADEVALMRTNEALPKLLSFAYGLVVEKSDPERRARAPVISAAIFAPALFTMRLVTVVVANVDVADMDKTEPLMLVAVVVANVDVPIAENVPLTAKSAFAVDVPTPIFPLADI